MYFCAGAIYLVLLSFILVTFSFDLDGEAEDKPKSIECFIICMCLLCRFSYISLTVDVPHFNLIDLISCLAFLYMYVQ